MAETQIEFGKGIEDSSNCAPANDYTKTQFAELQRWINRHRYAKGLPTISVDGVIGKKTLEALKSVYSFDPWGLFMLNTLGCFYVAQNVAEITIELVDPSLKNPPANSPNARVATRDVLDPTKKISTNASSPVDGMGWSHAAAFLAIAGGVFWFTSKRKKGGKRRRK